jgi:hypothetical protein
MDHLHIRPVESGWLAAKEKNLFPSIGALASSLECCAILDQRPSLFRAKNAIVFVLLD